MKMGGVTLGGGKGEGRLPKWAVMAASPPPKDLMEVSNVPPPPEGFNRGPQCITPPRQNNTIEMEKWGRGEKGGVNLGGGERGEAPTLGCYGLPPPPPQKDLMGVPNVEMNWEGSVN